MYYTCVLHMCLMMKMLKNIIKNYISMFTDTKHKSILSLKGSLITMAQQLENIHEILSHVEKCSCLRDLKLLNNLTWVKWVFNQWEDISRRMLNLTHPRVRLEGGACVMTEVGDGMVGWRASKPKCSGREPGRTIVGVGAELLGGVS